MHVLYNLKKLNYSILITMIEFHELSVKSSTYTHDCTETLSIYHYGFCQFVENKLQSIKSKTLFMVPNIIPI